jgi:hypothetical protein
MEGISIGTEGDGRWFIGLNFEYRDWENITGLPGLNTYKMDEDMTLLSDELRLSPKLLIQW